MKNFHDFYFGLTPQERALWVASVGTTIGYAERMAGGFKMPSLPMAIRMVRASGGQISFDSIIETYEARHGAIA